MRQGHCYILDCVYVLYFSFMQPFDACDFRQNAVIQGKYPYGTATDFQDYDIKITTSLAITAESVALVFVGYERNEKYIIETVSNFLISCHVHLIRTFKRVVHHIIVFAFHTI